MGIKSKFIASSILALSITGNSFASDLQAAQNPNEEPKVAYLFTYFNGNAPHEEQICYALSDDGYIIIYGFILIRCFNKSHHSFYCILVTFRSYFAFNAE